jgi:uncharacterized protein (TIGR02996 family)
VAQPKRLLKGNSVDERAAFLQAIIEQPGDDAPRLVFADWLEDNNDPERAEFIRVQCECARLPEDDSHRPALEDREHELLARNEQRWLGPLPRYIADWQFERGFLTACRTSTCTLVESGDDLFARHPITRLTLEPSDAYDPGPVKELGAKLWLSRIEELTFSGWEVGPGALEPVVASPHLKRLHTLDISWEGGDYASELLSRCRFLGQLRKLACVAAETDELVEVLDRMPLVALDLGNSAVASDGLAPLLRSDCASRLTDLGLGDNPLGAADWEAFHDTAVKGRFRRLDIGCTELATEGISQLLTASCLAELTALNLSDASPGPDQLEAVAASAFWKRAEELHLMRDPCSTASLQKLCEPRGPKGLRILDLTHARVTTKGIRHLCAAPFADTLTRLDLCGSILDDKALAMIAGSGRFRRVRNLDLRANQEKTRPITDDGFASLANAANLAGVRSINLHGTALSTRAVEVLLNGPHWKLSALNLGGTGLTPGAIKVLARSPRLARLTELDLGFNKGLGGRALLPLAESPYLSPLCRLGVPSDPLDSFVREVLKERLGRRVNV